MSTFISSVHIIMLTDTASQAMTVRCSAGELDMVSSEQCRADILTAFLTSHPSLVHQCMHIALVVLWPVL